MRSTTSRGSKITNALLAARRPGDSPLGQPWDILRPQGNHRLGGGVLVTLGLQATKLLLQAAGLLVLASLLLASDAWGGSANRLTVGGQEALILKPDRPTNRLVIYVHGAGGTASAVTEQPVLPLTESLLAHGFAVAASNAHGPQNWGNPRSVTDYVRLAHLLPYRRIYLLA